jgi:hypothetical protein
MPAQALQVSCAKTNTGTFSEHAVYQMDTMRLADVRNCLQKRSDIVRQTLSHADA